MKCGDKNKLNWRNEQNNDTVELFALVNFESTARNSIKKQFHYFTSSLKFHSHSFERSPSSAEHKSQFQL
jgi:hypothetical protein